jgi:hypothetical protein
VSSRCRSDFAGVFAGAEEQRRCRGAEVQRSTGAEKHRCTGADMEMQLSRC